MLHTLHINLPSDNLVWGKCSRFPNVKKNEHELRSDILWYINLMETKIICTQDNKMIDTNKVLHIILTL